MNVDADIQQDVGEEFCKRLDDGEGLFFLLGWAIEEMNKRQRERQI